MAAVGVPVVVVDECAVSRTSIIAILIIISCESQASKGVVMWRCDKTVVAVYVVLVVVACVVTRTQVFIPWNDLTYRSDSEGYGWQD